MFRQSRRDGLNRGKVDVQRVPVQFDGVSVGDDPLRPEGRAQLAETPAQGRAGVFGVFAKQIA